MRPVFDLLSDTSFIAFGWTLVHSLWQGTIIAAVTIGLFQIIGKKNASIRYNLGVGLLSLQVLVSIGTFLFYKLTETPATVRASLSFTSPISTAATLPVRDIHQTVSFGKMVNLWISGHISELVICWLIGASLLMIRFAGAWVYTRILRSQSSPVKDRTWLVRFGVLVAKLNISQSVELRETAKVMTPIVIGAFKPVILLPIGLLSGFSMSQVEAILSHELAHIRRNDYLVNLLQSFVEVVFFFHPALWWLSERIRTEREHCCDDIAISVCGDKMTYAHALVKVAEWQSSPTLAMAFASKKTLLHRISRVLGVNPKQSPYKVNWMASILFVPLFISLSIFAVGQKQNATTPKKVKTTVHQKNQTLSVVTIDDEIVEPKIDLKSEIEPPAETFNIDSEFDFAAFSSDTVNRKKLEEQHQKMEKLQEKMEPLHSQMEELNRKMEMQNFQMERLDREMQKLDWKRDKVFDSRNKILDQRQALMDNSPKKGKPQLSEAELEKQMDQLESQIKDQEGQIEAVNAQAAQIRKQALELRESQEMKNIKLQIEQVQNSVEEIQEQIEVEANIAEKFEWVAPPPEPPVAPTPKARPKVPKPPKPATPNAAPAPPKPAKAGIPPVAPVPPVKQ